MSVLMVWLADWVQIESVQQGSLKEAGAGGNLSGDQGSRGGFREIGPFPWRCHIHQTTAVLRRQKQSPSNPMWSRPRSASPSFKLNPAILQVGKCCGRNHATQNYSLLLISPQINDQTRGGVGRKHSIRKRSTKQDCFCIILGPRSLSNQLSVAKIENI